MRRVGLIVVGVLVLAGCNVRVSTDPFTNTTSQHRTQVEPDTFSFGSTIVSAFQSGRFFDGGASDIGWATSTDGGSNWTHGFLPGITKFEKNGPFDRVSVDSLEPQATGKRNVTTATSAYADALFGLGERSALCATRSAPAAGAARTPAHSIR